MTAGLFAAVGAGGVILTSADGQAWTSQSTPTSGTLNGVGWSPQRHYFVAVGDGGLLLTSVDGESWTQRSTPTTANLWDAAWSPSLDLFAAVGAGGTVLTSSSGETWTLRSTPNTSLLRGIAWSPSLGRFVAVGSNGVVITSENGTTWTNRSTPVSATMWGAAWSPDLSQFVAVGAVNTIMSSTNGTSWTLRAGGGPGGSTRTGAAWSPSAELWVVSTTNGNVVVSDDGEDWSSEATGATGETLRGIAWSDDAGRFVAVGDNGVAVTSADGDSWSLESTPVSSDLFGVTWAQMNRPPDAPLLVYPVGGQAVNRAQTNRFDWNFSDPDAGDSQSEFRLQIREDSGPTVLDVTSETSATHYDLPPTLAQGDHEWRVRTRDSVGEQGPFSSWEPFTADDPPPGPSITDPVNNQTIPTQLYEVVWSAADQDAYQLRRVADDDGSPDTETVLFDTGTVESTSRSLVVEFPSNNQAEHVQVRVRRDALWSEWSSVRVQVSYTPPPTPLVTVHADLPTGGHTVAITNPAPGGGEPDVDRNEVWRRRVGEFEEVRRSRNAGSSFVDWAVASDVAYEYMVRAVADNGTTSDSAWTQ